MARFYGNVGYGTTSEVAPGVWSDSITERAFKGEVLRESRSLVKTDHVADDISLSKRISISAAEFAPDNFLLIKFVEWAGSLWTVSSVDVERPRLILTLGGVYDGPRADDNDH